MLGSHLTFVAKWTRAYAGLARAAQRPAPPPPPLSGEAKAYVRNLRLMDVEMQAIVAQQDRGRLALGILQDDAARGRFAHARYSELGLA